MSRSKYTAGEKYSIIMEYLEGTHTRKEIAALYKISIYTLKMWHSKYEQHEIDGLKESCTWKKYSKELKNLAVKYFLTERYSKYEIIRKYDISGRSVLMGWIKKYNGLIEGFWRIIKSEKYYFNKYNTFQELEDAIDDYIYFYNHKRLQKRLNSLSPMEFRTLAA